MEKQYTPDTNEMEIDLREIFGLLIRKIWIILLSGLTLALIAIVYTMFLVTPMYESTTRMYVLNKQDSGTLTNQDMQTSLSLTQDYVELIKSRTVMEGVIARLDLDLTSEQLLSKISVASQADTRIITISVQDADPYEASEIANAVREVSAGHIQQVMDIEAVNVVDTANIPDEKVSPSLSRNALLGGLLGVVAAAGIIVLVYLLNDTIKTSEDVEKYLNLSVLGAIPLMETEKKSRKHKGKGGFKK